MSKTRREKRKLKRLSTNPNYIKPYNHKVRLYNQKIRKKKARDKSWEIGISIASVLLIGLLVWIKASLT